MCAVLVRKQLECETHRRQWRLVFGLLLLLLGLCLDGVCGAGMPPSMPMAWPESALDECYEEYLLASVNASHGYESEHGLCELRANETIIDLDIDEAMERQQIEAAHAELCGNLEHCSSLENNLDYFQCVSDSGSTNLQLIAEIEYNATSAHTRLREDYDEVQQTFVLCTLEAHSKYVNSMQDAYEELFQCRQEAQI